MSASPPPPAPPKLIKRKRITPAAPDKLNAQVQTSTAPPSVVKGPAPVKRKRVTPAFVSQSDPKGSEGPEGHSTTKKKRATRRRATATTTTTSGESKATAAATNGNIDENLISALTYGTTRKQRHWVLKQMLLGVQRLWPDPDNIPDVDSRTILDYVTRAEQRLYIGVFGQEMDPCYNLYRANLYRKFAFEVIYALRANGRVLMQKYEPELLVSLPPHVLSKDTTAGEVYRLWREHQEIVRIYEEEMLRAKRETKGEGWLRCPKCGGKFEVSELQMRGGDEPATIFRTCQNCGFTKRNG